MFTRLAAKANHRQHVRHLKEERAHCGRSGVPNYFKTKHPCDHQHVMEPTSRLLESLRQTKMVSWRILRREQSACPIGRNLILLGGVRQWSRQQHWLRQSCLLHYQGSQTQTLLPVPSQPLRCPSCRDQDPCENENLVWPTETSI